MKSTFLRLAIAGSLVTAGVAAHADVVLPSTGNGELVLFVLDTTTGTGYARGIQIQEQTVLPIASILPKTGSGAGSYTVPVTTSYTLPTVLADSNLTSFLAQDGGHDSFVYGIEGGSISGGNAPGHNVFTFTTLTDLTQTTNQTQSDNLSIGYNALESTLATVNGQINSGVSKDGASTPAGASGIWGQGSVQDSRFWYGINPAIDTGIALGSASTLWTVTGNGTGVNEQVYSAGQQVELLLNGNLVSVGGTAPVPLPAAIWLLGSGLLGLAGIGRRRAAAAAV